VVTPIRTRVVAAAVLHDLIDDWRISVLPPDKLCEVVVLGIDRTGEGDPPAETDVAKCIVFIDSDSDWMLAELPLGFVRSLVPLGTLALETPDDLSSLDATEPTFEEVFTETSETTRFIFIEPKAKPTGIFLAALLSVEGDALLTQWKKRRPIKRTESWLKRVKSHSDECAEAAETALELLGDVAVIRKPGAWQRTELISQIQDIVDRLRPRHVE
jgi:hypothetical protein